MTQSNALTAFEIEDVLSRRWSPRAYSPDDVMSADRLGPAFEAARWSASSGNSQPWSFVVGFRGDETFEKLVASLEPGNAVWASQAGAIVANIAESVTEEGKARFHALYDLGQAVAHFSVQATASGLVVHQMGGFNRDQIEQALGLSERHSVISLMTVGVLGDPSLLPERLQEREIAPRVRKPLSEIVSGSVNYA